VDPDPGGDLTTSIDSTDELGALLGARLRERRRELGRTLAEVAAAADVSTGYLSTIENATSVPSLPVLARLAHALELPLAEILRTSASTRLARGRITSTLGNASLAAEGSRMQIVRSAAKPGTSGPSPVALGESDVFLFVLDGRLEVEVDGQTFDVGPGDALHCDLPRELRWRVLGEERAVGVWTAMRPSGRDGS
jgi:mannose-6-phosphate isomerase-like protein (cupin superfamily)